MANETHNSKLSSVYPNKFNKRENALNIRNNTTAVIDAALVMTDEDGINIIRATASAAVTLPKATNNKGRIIQFIVQDAGETITITQNADDANIDGADSNFALTSGATDTSIDLYSTGSEWLITSSAILAAIPTTALSGETHTVDGANLIPKLVRANFLFSEQATAGTLALLGSTDIPDNAIITGGFVDVTTTFADDNSDVSTIAIQVNSADDIVAAVSIAAATDWDAGLHDIVPDATGSTAVKTTAVRDISVVIGGSETLTAGEFDVYLYYVIGS